MKAPSMTLSESLAMDQFEFLGSEDSILASRFSSRNSTDAGSESECVCACVVQPHGSDMCRDGACAYMLELCPCSLVSPC